MWSFIHPETVSSYSVSPVPNAAPLPTTGRTLNMLCPTCTCATSSPRWTLDSKKHLIDGQPHHISLQALYEAAQGGCHLCTLFWDAMIRNPPDKNRVVDFENARQDMVLRFLEHPSNKREIFLDVYGINNWRLEIGGLTEKDGWHTRGSQYRDGRGWGPQDEVIPWIPLNLDPASQVIFSQIEEWISECTTKHENCQSRMSAAVRLPSRVIDVGPLDGSQDPFLLTDTHKVPQVNHKYIALTHRWPQPGEKMLTTTTEVLSKRKKGIPMDLLPKTFRDAIIITRKLNLRYVWIDSLCILQDSQEDWEQEAARMHFVYRDAYLTISADAGTEGCLITRDPLTIRPCMLEKSVEGEELGVLPHPFADFRENIDQGLLSTRGWIVQERLLSRRILHFAQHEVYWECITTTASERHPSHPEKSFRAQFGSMKQLLKQIQLPLNPSTDIQPSKELLKEYYNFIQHYTQREFTFSSDKLPALSGIIQSIHEHLNTQTPFRESYLAGLWRQDLLGGLLWEIRPIDQSGRLRNPDSRSKGPSWAWSSVNEEAVYMNYRTPGDYIKKYSARVLEAEVVLAGANPAGAVESGYLVLEGALKKAYEKSDELEKMSLLMDAKMDLPIDDALEIEEMWLLRILVWKDETVKEFSGDSVLEDADFETGEWATALILIRTGESSNEYRRIGLISMWPNLVFSKEEHSQVMII